MLCENCNETSPSPVSEVTVNQTLVSLDDGSGAEHEWTETPTVPTAAFTMDDTFVTIYLVTVGGVPQSESQYTVAGTSLVFGTNVPAGYKVVVRGVVEV